MAKKTKLPNGLRVVTEYNKSVETVVVSVGIAVGNRHESSKEEGLSHALEHMLFKGTKTRTYQELNEAVDFVGARTNAFTSNERTVYYIKTPKEHVELAVDILSDQVLNSIFPADEMKKEMEVIEQEIKRSYDDPNDVLYYNFAEVAFKGNQLSRPILGTAKKVLAYTPADMLAYYAKHYHPKNMILSVAGNVKHAEVVALAKKYFPEVDRKFKKTTPKKATWNPGQTVVHVESENQVNVMVGFGIRGRKDLTKKEFITMHMVNDILTSGMGSKLTTEIREKRGLVYSVGSYIQDYEELGYFGVYGGTDHNKVEEFLEATTLVLKSFNADLTDRDLQKSKNSMKSRLSSSVESISSVSTGCILAQ
jgi:predicted Zn-dependent peptidase